MPRSNGWPAPGAGVFLLAMAVFCVFAGCARTWETIPCFELGEQVYTKKYYKPEYYESFDQRLEAQAFYLYGTGDHEEALECFLQLRDRTSLPRAATMIGIILTRRGELGQGEEWIRLGLENSNDADWAYGALVWHYVQCEKYAEAEQVAKEMAEITASTKAWSAVKTVRGLRDRAATREKWNRRLPWLIGGVLLALTGVVFWSRGLRRRRRERARRQHIKRMEKELERLDVSTSVSIDEVRAKLLQAKARSKAAAFLHELTLDGHLRSGDSTLRGLQGLLAIYGQSLEELDRLEITEGDRESKRHELEKALKQMVRSLSGADTPPEPDKGVEE